MAQAIRRWNYERKILELGITTDIEQKICYCVALELTTQCTETKKRTGVA